MKEKPATITGYELDELRTLIEQRSGILFDASRERFFSLRIREHLAEKGVKGGELLRVIRSSNVEYDALLERLLTQETSFFRYPAIYAALKNRILPEIQEKKFWLNPRTLRIWSAGCSTGEEPYSIAIAVVDALTFAEAWQIEILATDISPRALRHATHGVYSQRSLENLAPEQVETYFTHTKHGYSVKPRIRRMVSFAQMNLAQSVYVGKLDCIFCMNVLMYFSEERRNSLIRRFYDYLEPGGYLLLGHAESISNLPVRFSSVVIGDCRMYQKPVAETAWRNPVTVAGRL
ncbi:MAG: protein-glutamate O-methyltransferase CheR [Candidatus Acidiferrales bacterium]|jgi:chemotaxis protein methyltransferase CheR